MKCKSGMLRVAWLDDAGMSLHEFEKASTPQFLIFFLRSVHKLAVFSRFICSSHSL